MEKKNPQYLQALRQAMKENGIYAVVVSGTDPTRARTRPPTGAAASGSPAS